MQNVTGGNPPQWNQNVKSPVEILTCTVYRNTREWRLTWEGDGGEGHPGHQRVRKHRVKCLLSSVSTTEKISQVNQFWLNDQTNLTKVRPLFML